MSETTSVYQDHIGALSQALSGLEDKKEAVDKAQAVLSEANRVYQDALGQARELHAKFQAAVDDILPSVNARR